MTEPTQPATTPLAKRAAPTREVATKWGLLHARCTHPQRVRFSTDRTIGGSESFLLINRVRYPCTVEFTRGHVRDDRRSVYRRPNDNWHADSAWHTFRRHGERGDATDNARRVLYDQVLPALADWLDTDARDLMRQGAADRHVECYGLADAAERALSRAFQTVHDLAGAIAAGRTITDDEEAFLRRP